MPDNVSADVVAGTDGEAADFNALREDVLRHGQGDACRLDMDSSGTQTIADSTETALTLYEGIYYNYDNNDMHDNSTNPTRVTIQNDGIYRVSGRITFDPDNTGYRYVKVRKNGSTVIGQFVDVTGQYTGYDFVPFDIMHEFDDGDYLEIIVWQNSGGNLDVVSQVLPIRWSWVEVTQMLKKAS